MREPVTAYLGLGSNLGDREDNLGRALALLAARVKPGGCVIDLRDRTSRV